MTNPEKILDANRMWVNIWSRIRHKNERFSKIQNWNKSEVLKTSASDNDDSDFSVPVE